MKVKKLTLDSCLAHKNTPKNVFYLIKIYRYFPAAGGQKTDFSRLSRPVTLDFYLCFEKIKKSSRRMDERNTLVQKLAKSDGSAKMG